GRPVFAFGGALDVAAENKSEKLEAVTDPERRQAEGEDLGGNTRCVFGVDARGASRENHGARAQAADFLEREIVRMDLAVDAELADAPRDELGGLRAEVEDEDGVARRTDHGAYYHGSGVRGRGHWRQVDAGIERAWRLVLRRGTTRERLRRRLR